MIPTVWLSSVCCKVWRLYGLVGVRTKAYFKMTVGIMQGKLPWLYREGGAVIFLVFQSIWGSDEAGNHDPLAGSDSASIFYIFPSESPSYLL